MLAIRQRSRLRAKVLRALLGIHFCLGAAATGLDADVFYEKWFATSAGLAESPVADENSFADMWVGDDMLPYTSDDEPLDPDGNSGGTWTASALDSDGDGELDFRFTLIRQGDDDMQTYASNSEFEFGVIAEGEDWHDFHNADNTGPCIAPCTLNPGLPQCTGANGTPGEDCCQDCAYGEDFEHNDGLSNWEGYASWYWYNNLRANQRGLGGSRYYFEWKDALLNPGYFDEVQGWRKGLQMQRNFDNGELPERRFVRGHNATIKGLFVPFEEIPELEDGELDALFNWYQGDMAAYFRDTLLPRLEDPGLEIWMDSTSCASTGLPPAWVILEQGEFPVTVRNDDSSRTSAAYFGITPTGGLDPDGYLETEAVYRWSAIYILWEDSEQDPALTRSPRIDLFAESGPPRNLWARDTFAREVDGSGIPGNLGNLELGCVQTPGQFGTPEDCWYFVTDPTPNNGLGCASEEDWALTLPSGSGPDDSWIRLPISGVESLDPVSAPVRAEVDLNVGDPDAGGNLVQVVLVRDSLPVAWAEIGNNAEALLGVGGEFLNPVDAADLTGLGEFAVEIPSEPGVYTRLELILDGAAKRLTLTQDGEEAGTLDFSSVEDLELAVDGLHVWTESAVVGGDNTVTLDQIAVLQDLPALFRRGDVDGNGLLEITDPVNNLEYQFLGTYDPDCLDALDFDDNGLLELTDPVGNLGHQFLGDPPPVAPGKESCGPDPTPDVNGCATPPDCS